MGWAKGVYWSVLFIYPSDHENKLFSFFFLVLSLCTGNPQHMPVQIYEQCVFWRISFIKCKFLWPMIDYRTAQKAANKYYLTMYLKKKKKHKLEEMILSATSQAIYPFPWEGRLAAVLPQGFVLEYIWSGNELLCWVKGSLVKQGIISYILISFIYFS